MEFKCKDFIWCIQIPEKENFRQFVIFFAHDKSTLHHYKTQVRISVAIQKDIESALLAAQRDAENTTMAKFMRNLESRIYSQLSKQLVESLFKQCDLTVDPTCVEATFGSFALEGNTISYQKTTCNTEVNLPNFDFNFCLKFVIYKIFVLKKSSTFW